MITFALGKYDFDNCGVFTFSEEGNKTDLELISTHAPITMEILEKQKKEVTIGFIKSPLKFGGMVNVSNRGPVLMMNIPGLFEAADMSDMPEKYRDMVMDLIVASSLIHELVHFEQVKSGRLMMAGDFIDWEGELHFCPLDGKSYFNSPWEQEAFLTQAKWMEQNEMGPTEFTMMNLKNSIEPIKNILTGV